ncbi:nudix hydrolase 13, mitochondrial-like [Juglans microcarpa x Juglans regia]|uniref:nudix hydrolase 13, mitochondrial-like n=1 Tax=Juglans microcarpa x Juglans regia TaxID=2249226 RepID=UPI001B7EADF0|nr:nudix hydrolase 13, mitochondrial-like [Juglans microcarpa x Juglans regia]XP_041014365.1 nudix hydrolase 13, mitochondrial-like [Juglans microcarpa x Juglans regia]
MSSLPARTGRYRQRYKDHLRLVSGCIPYRLGKNFNCCYNNPEKKLLVLMISSPDRDDLVFPKGGWENDETIDEAARREALEEAGVRGILSENPLGVWEFRSKSRQNSSSLEGGCRGYMFALNVTEELDSWPEQASHDRKWLTTEEAFKFCRYDWMRDALRRFLNTLSEESSLKMAGESKETPVIRPVADAGEVRQMSSPGCFGNPSGVQHLENSCCNCEVQG